MKWLSQNWFKLGILLLLATAVLIFGLSMSPTATLKDNPQTAEQRLTKRWREFWDLTLVGLCQKAYDDYLTPNSKRRYTYAEFEKFGCLNKKSQIKSADIEKVVFSNENRAEIKILFDNGFEARAKHYNWSIETWYAVDGQWFREF